MRRILLGAFGDVFGRAIRLLLDQAPTTFAVTSAEWITLPLLEDVRPDVVIVDLDNETTLSAVGDLSGRFPEMAVIACSAEEPFMMVFPAFHRGESYGSVLTLDALAAVVVEPWRAPATGLGPPDVSPTPVTWNPLVLDAVGLRQAAKLARAQSRSIRRETEALVREARRLQMASGLGQDRNRPPTR